MKDRSNLICPGRITNGGETYVDPYERIVTAIIVQAAKDYRRLFRRKLNGKRLLPSEEQEFNETEDFFYENNFKDVIEIDGEYILNQIVLNEIKMKHERKPKKKRKRTA